MSADKIADDLSKALQPFIDNNIKEPTKFYKMISGAVSYTSQSLTLTTMEDEMIFCFHIGQDKRIQNFTNFFEVEIINFKYAPLYNKFIEYCHDNGDKIFSTYIEKMKTCGQELKLITSVEILPYSERKIVKKSDYITITSLEYAKITTPFEVVSVYKYPKFTLHDGIVYLNDQFRFVSVDDHYLFERNIEDDDLMIHNSVVFGEFFYEQHRNIIISKISSLYNISFKDITLWSNELIVSYYPVLVMEKY